jgi:hypothetical protein
MERTNLAPSKDVSSANSAAGGFSAVGKWAERAGNASKKKEERR